MSMWLSVSGERARAQTLLEGFLRAKPRTNREDSHSPDSLAARAWVDRLMYVAGRSDSDRAAMVLRLAVSAVLAIFAALFFKQAVLILLIPALVIAEYWALQRRVFARAQQFERDYPALLLALASAVRTGLDPLVALAKCGDLFAEQSLVKRELSRVQEQIAQGESEEAVIHSFADSIQHPDLDLFRTAFVLARQEGASLSECLQRLARVTRHRQSFRRRVRGAVAMQKLSAIGIGVCALIIGLIQGLTNPRAFQLALASPVGSRALFISVFLVVVGIGWMFSLTKAKL